MPDFKNIGAALSRFSPKQVVIVFVVAVVVIISVVIIGANLRDTTAGGDERVLLTVWGTEPFGAFKGAIDAYEKVREAQDARVVYKQFDPARYEEELTKAFLAGRGPDVFMIRNTDLPRWQDVLSPVGGGQYNLLSLRQQFPFVVEQDFTVGGEVYALPLYIDTLALLYNKDTFDNYQVTAPPATWTEFLATVSRLRSVDALGQLERKAAAVGGSRATIDVAPDLVNLLLLQSGTAFTALPKSIAEDAPALRVFDFYLQFSNPSSPYYTWNDDQRSAVENFASGEVAMLFGYLSNMAEAHEKNPFLRAEAAAMLQLEGAQTAVNYPRYVGLAVSRTSRMPQWGWDFVLYLTTQPQVSSMYLTRTGHPPALRSLIAPATEDPSLNVFAAQALTARSWRQVDREKSDTIIDNGIRAVLAGRQSSRAALQRMRDQIARLR